MISEVLQNFPLKELSQGTIIHTGYNDLKRKMREETIAKLNIVKTIKLNLGEM